MARFIESTGTDPIQRTRERDVRFGSWLKMKIEDAISKRFWLDQTWRFGIRQYEAIPELRSKELPADNGQYIIEVPVAASMADSIYSTIYDLIWNTTPPIAVRASTGYHNHAAAFQALTDKLLVDDFVNIHGAADEVIADTVQMGTGAYYTVNAREVVKRAAYRELNTGPRVFSVPPEDLVVPGGTFPDTDMLQIIAYRQYYFESELIEAAAQNGWDVSKFMIAGNIDWVRQRRIEAMKSDEDLQYVGGLYETFAVHCYFDYDQDGFAEDLEVIWDRTSFEVADVRYAPYDCRPFSISRYQLRPHVFYGIGVWEMAAPFEREVTEWHNFKMQNAHLSNARIWAYRLGALGIGEELKISPNKTIGLGDPQNDLVEKKMSDNYPTAQQYEAATLALAEMRVGTPAIGTTQGVAAGKRVPAATAMSALQQQNRRFTAPFDNIRRALANCVNQCHMRLREQYLKGGEWRRNTLEYLVYAVGVKNTELIEEIYKTSRSNDMRDKVIIEVTATSQSINRQADKQNAMERMQVMGAYYEKMLAIGQVILNPQAPPELKQLAVGVANGATESVRAFLRTFDDVRDPDVFIPETFRNLKADGGSAGGQQAQPEQPNAGGGAGGQPGSAPPPEGAPDSASGGVAPTIGGSAELGRGERDEGIDG
jgi:hypothetical protein